MLKIGCKNTFFQKKHTNTCIIFNNDIRLLRIIKKADDNYFKSVVL